MSTPKQVDPELITAIRDHRGTYDAYSKAQADAASLTGPTDIQNRRAALAHAGSLHSDMRVRCIRLPVEIDGFLALMAEDAAIRTRMKKNPTLRQLCAAIEARDEQAQRRAKETAEAAKRAAFLAKDAAAAALDLQQARLAITGYGS